MANTSYTPSARRENTRDKRSVPAVISFTLAQIMEHFTQNLDAIRAQSDIAADMVREGNRSEAEFIWRTQILYLVSALDFYMHELTTYGMVAMYRRQWKRTPDYEKIRLPISAIDEGMRASDSAEWLVEYINDAFGRDTMTSYPRIKDQADLLGIDIRRCMEEAFPHVSKKHRAVAEGSEILGDISSRRNRIAHQTDRDPDNARQAEISDRYVAQSISHIEGLVLALHRAAKEKDTPQKN